MNTENKTNDIKIIIAGAYDIKPIISVQRFNLTFSKFTTQDHHFLIKTLTSIYFLKRYDISHLKRIRCEINAINKFKDKIHIPKIFQTNEKKDYLIDKNNIFVLYEYIDALNLKDSKEETQSFFDILCDVESKLIKLKLNNLNFFDFKFRILKFESETKKLLRVLENDTRPHAKRDIKYIKFLIGEVKKIKSEILNLKIVKNFIHGDFLMQNLIRDDNRVWVLDWEKSKEYITSIDILKSITFTIFNPSKKNMNLDIDMFIKWSQYCFQKIPLSKEEVSNAFILYYFHFITGIDFLIKFYIEKQNLNEKMIGEDFLISKWFKKNRKKMQLSLNQILPLGVALTC